MEVYRRDCFAVRAPSPRSALRVGASDRQGPDALQRADLFVARLRGGVSSSAIVAIAEGTNR
jgi:hypothetical protein